MTMHPISQNNRSSSRSAATALAAALALSLTLGASAALAKGPAGGYTEGGGYTGPGPALSTVSQAKEMRDDTPVIRHLGDERYVFKDNTGTVNVEIDHKRWRGQSVGPNDLVEISGEVEKDWTELEIDVKSVVKK